MEEDQAQTVKDLMYYSKEMDLCPVDSEKPLLKFQ